MSGGIKVVHHTQKVSQWHNELKVLALISWGYGLLLMDNPIRSDRKHSISSRLPHSTGGF
jgi:hypothetical protein